MKVLFINPRFPELVSKISEYSDLTVAFTYSFPLKDWPHTFSERIREYLIVSKDVIKINFNEYDIVHVQDRFNLLPSAIKRIVSDTKLIYTCHEGLWLSDVPCFIKFLKRSPARNLEGLSMLLADGVIALSRDLALKLGSIFPALTSKIYIVPNGINTSFFRPLNNFHVQSIREKLGYPEYLILCVSRFGKEKGIEVLVKAMRRLVSQHKFQDIKCLMKLHGDGYYKVFIYDLIKRLELETRIIIYEGLWSQARLLYLYSTADVFVLPSLYDAFPMTLLEAMACGKPVIGPNYGGSRDMIISGVNGYTFKVGDDRDLARVLSLLLKDREKMTHMGQKSRTIAMKFFNWEKIAFKTIRIYESILNRRG